MKKSELPRLADFFKISKNIYSVLFLRRLLSFLFFIAIFSLALIFTGKVNAGCHYGGDCFVGSCSKDSDCHGGSRDLQPGRSTCISSNSCDTWLGRCHGEKWICDPEDGEGGGGDDEDTPTPTPTPSCTQAPATPVVLRATLDCAGISNKNQVKVRLNWNPVPGAARYALRVDKGVNSWNGNCASPNSGDICDDNVAVSEYIFTAEAGATYRWWVSAVNGCGWSSGQNPNPTFQAKSCCPNCQDVTVTPSTVTVGQPVQVCANYSGSTEFGYDNVGLFADRVGGTACFTTFNYMEDQGGQANHCYQWTPTAAGDYKICCRAWNDAICECRGSGSGLPNCVNNQWPRVECSGPNACKTVTVTTGQNLSCNKLLPYADSAHQNLIEGNEFNNLKPGDKIYLLIKGSCNHEEGIDEARVHYRPDSASWSAWYPAEKCGINFCYTLTISQTGHYQVEAQVHNPVLGWR